jgi:hypothetical protein
VQARVPRVDQTVKIAAVPAQYEVDSGAERTGNGEDRGNVQVRDSTTLERETSFAETPADRAKSTCRQRFLIRMSLHADPSLAASTHPIVASPAYRTLI